MNVRIIVVAIVLSCLTITCNGQFKILGLLDTKSELNNGNVENIRSLVGDVGDEPAQLADVGDSDKISDPESTLKSDDSDKGNVNFIKPLLLEPTSVSNERTSELSEATTSVAAIENSVSSSTTNEILVRSDRTNSEDVFNEDIVDEPSPIRNRVSIQGSNTEHSTTTIATKTYRKTLRPNIRKFSYIEARSFHHPDSPNHVTPRNDYQYVKVVKYRNKYKSKCRCERIWNCPKIQISIQRCEPDYFMCCF